MYFLQYDFNHPFYVVLLSYYPSYNDGDNPVAKHPNTTKALDCFQHCYPHLLPPHNNPWQLQYIHYHLHHQSELGYFTS